MRRGDKIGIDEDLIDEEGGNIETEIERKENLVRSTDDVRNLSSVGRVTIRND